MTDYNLSGAHIIKTLAYLILPDFREEYLNSMNTDKQREWAKEILNAYKSNQNLKINLVTGKDSICLRCFEYRKEDCTYTVAPIELNNQVYNFGKYNISELLKNFNIHIFLKSKEKSKNNFIYNLMQHM